jgi:uncharacterized phage protein gp47/JayE
MSVNVPTIQWLPSGLVIPPESAILSGVQADINTAFGGNLNPQLSSPQGQLASSETAIIGDRNDIIANVVNQFDPDFADGRWQDAIGRFYFIDRKQATPTIVSVLCTGLAGTVIPAGSQAADASANVYLCTLGGTIPVGGSTTLQFAAQNTGPIPCPAHTITTIYQAIPGWDTVDNVADGIPGTVVESRTDFETRRRQSVAKNGTSGPPAIYGAVAQLPGVSDLYVKDNPSGNSVTIGLVTLKPHSLWCCVVGGDPNAIAQAIYSKKDLGCDYNGNTTIIVTDPSGYSQPYPQYPVTYQVATVLGIKFAVQIANLPNLPANVVNLIQQALINAFLGMDGGARARIGSSIYAYRFSAPIQAVSPFVQIMSILLGPVTPTLAGYTMGIDVAPVLSAGDITVTLV